MVLGIICLVTAVSKEKIVLNNIIALCVFSIIFVDFAMGRYSYLLYIIFAFMFVDSYVLYRIRQGKRNK